MQIDTIKRGQEWIIKLNLICIWCDIQQLLYYDYTQ